MEIMINKQLSLAVHLHLYYLEMWPEIKRLLANMGDYPYDLYVTMVAENSQIAEDIRAFHQNSTIWVVENRGYDIGPFIDFLHHIDLNQYDLIMKLHTKNKNNGIETYIGNYVFDRSIWVYCLTNALLGSSRIFKKNIQAFTNLPKLGVIGSKYLIASKLPDTDGVQSGALTLIKQLGFAKTANLKFIAGTMFMCRSKLLQKIKENYKISDFDITDGHVKNGTLAHMMERVLGYVVTAQGYEIKGFDKNYILFLRKVRRFIWQNKLTKNNFRLIKICKIPVFHRKVSQA